MSFTDDIDGQNEFLLGVARAILGSHHDSEDVAQDAWTAILEGRVAAAKSPRSWLGGLIRNLCRSKRRAQRREEMVKDAAAKDGVAESAYMIAVRTEVALELSKAIHDLPSEHREVLVRRYWDRQSPRQIAAELGFSNKKVSNLHQRALARLRSSLAQQTEDAAAFWKSFSLFALPATQRAAVGTFFIMPKIAVAVAVVLVAALALIDTQTPELVVDSADKKLAKVHPELELLAQTPPKTPITSELRKVAPIFAAHPSLAKTIRKMPAVGGPGFVMLEVFDMETLHPIKDLMVRLLSETRFAELKTRSPVQLRLSPGTYELLLLAPQFDPVVLEKIRIRTGETNAPGRILLTRGTAFLEGIVWLAQPFGPGPLTIELFGDGRNACSECRVERKNAAKKTCDTCGYASARSTVQCLPGTRFQFLNLAAGDYRVVVTADGRTLGTRIAKVKKGVRNSMDIDLRFSDLTITLLRANGKPFDGTWIEDNERFAGPIRFFFLDDGACCGATLAPPLDSGLPQGIAYEPELPSASMATPSPASQRKRGLEKRRTPGRKRGALERSDQPRRAGQTLWPSILTPPPQIKARPLVIERFSSSTFRIHLVPSCTDRILVTCGPYFTNVPIDPKNWRGKRLQIRLFGRCTLSSRMLAGKASCVSCHSLPKRVLR